MTLPSGGSEPNLAAVAKNPGQETQITWNQKGPADPR